MRSCIISCTEELSCKEIKVGFGMSEEESPGASKDLEELQKKLCSLIKIFQGNSKAFMQSPVGQYLDRHPFLALTLLLFVAVSAIPVGFFFFLVVLTSLASFVGVILLEVTARHQGLGSYGMPGIQSGLAAGLVISVGGLSLLCVLCGLCFTTFFLSGTVAVSYVVTSSFINCFFSPRQWFQQKFCDNGPPAMPSADLEESSRK